MASKDLVNSNFNLVEKTGGEKIHTLTIDEMPAHNHEGVTDADGIHEHLAGSFLDWYTKGDSRGIIGEKSSALDNPAYTSSNGSHTHNFSTNNTGEGQAHNNLQPYITCYMWKRTA